MNGKWQIACTMWFWLQHGMLFKPFIYSLNYNEITTFDIDSWISIHCYVVENWIKVSILLNF